MRIPPEIAAAMDRVRGLPGIDRVAAGREGKGWVVVIFSRSALPEADRRRILAAAGGTEIRFEKLGPFDLIPARPAFPVPWKRKRRRDR